MRNLRVDFRIQLTPLVAEPSPALAQLFLKTHDQLASYSPFHRNSSPWRNKRRNQAPLYRIIVDSLANNAQGRLTEPIRINSCHLRHVFFRCQDQLMIDDIGWGIYRDMSVNQCLIKSPKTTLTSQSVESTRGMQMRWKSRSNIYKLPNAFHSRCLMEISCRDCFPTIQIYVQLIHFSPSKPTEWHRSPFRKKSCPSSGIS